MKTLVVLFVALLVLGGAVPMALAQQDASSSSSSSSSAAPAAPAAPATPQAADKAPDVSVKAPDAKVDIKTDSKTEVSRDNGAGSASPRTEATRTSFFGLSPTAAIIVSVAVLLVVILAIVAMTNSGSTTYIDKGDRL